MQRPLFVREVLIGKPYLVQGQGWFCRVSGPGGAQLSTFGPESSEANARAAAEAYCKSVRLRYTVEE